MQIYIFGKSGEVPEALRTYAESRVWRAVGRVSNRLPWVAVRLTHREDHAVDSSVVCQLDGWLPGIGLVTARHVNVDTYVAIDRAAARLEQAVLRRIGEAESNETLPSTRRGNAFRNPGRVTRAFTAKQKGTDHATSRHDDHSHRSLPTSVARGSWTRV